MTKCASCGRKYRSAEAMARALRYQEIHADLVWSKMQSAGSDTADKHTLHASDSRHWKQHGEIGHG